MSTIKEVKIYIIGFCCYYTRMLLLYTDVVIIHGCAILLRHGAVQLHIVSSIILFDYTSLLYTATTSRTRGNKDNYFYSLLVTFVVWSNDTCTSDTPFSSAPVSYITVSPLPCMELENADFAYPALLCMLFRNREKDAMNWQESHE